MANEQYSEVYKIKCRAIWYDNGCPSPRKLEELKILPPDELGRTVRTSELKHWIFDGDWTQWKDVMDSEVATRTEEELLGRKVAVIKEQLEQTKVIRNAAYQNIKDGKFDSSASAVNAFFKASEAERGLMQIEKVIEDLAKRQTSDLQNEFKELAERAGATTVEAEDITEEKEDE